MADEPTVELTPDELAPALPAPPPQMGTETTTPAASVAVKFLKRFRKNAVPEPGTVLYDAVYEADGQVFYLREWTQAAFSSYDAERAQLTEESAALNKTKDEVTEEIFKLNGEAQKRQEAVEKAREAQPDIEFPDADISDILARGTELDAQAPDIEERKNNLSLAIGQMYDNCLDGYLVGLKEGKAVAQIVTRQDIEEAANSFKSELANVIENLSTPGKERVNFLAKR